MKGQYLVMDNAPIHKSEDIAKYILGFEAIDVLASVLTLLS